mgnify:CR=1 FL=1
MCIRDSLKKDVYDLAEANYKAIVYSILAKEERSAKNKELTESVKQALAEKYPEQEKVIGEILHNMEKDPVSYTHLTLPTSDLV